MTSFTWKRKAGENIHRDAAVRFGKDAKDEEVDLSRGGDDVFSERCEAKKPRLEALEDRMSKKRRLKDEGCVLSENERYWEALKKWDEAILLCPDDETLHEMKAQVLLELKEVYPAIQSAKHAVKLAPSWWIAHQTLGRAQLSIGEVQLAIRCFSKACHLKPDEEQLWEEDLKWACSLLAKSRELGNVAAVQTLPATDSKIVAADYDVAEKPFDDSLFEMDGADDSVGGSEVQVPSQLNPNTWIRLRSGATF